MKRTKRTCEAIMEMDPTSKKYPQNLMQYLRWLDPNAAVIDVYEKDEKLLIDTVESITNVKEENIFFRFWRNNWTLKFLSERYRRPQKQVKAILQSISITLVSMPEKRSAKK